jgi:type I restriction enzyme S subunit
MPRSNDGWTRLRFGEIAEHINDRVDDPASAGVDRYVGLEHLDPDSLRITRWGAPDEVSAQKLRFSPGDIIFGKRRAYQRKVAVADFEGICSAHAMVLRERPEKIAPGFLIHFMASDVFMERAVRISVGSLSPTINWSALRDQEFFLPSLEEQRSLSTLLSASEHAMQSMKVLSHEIGQVRRSLAEDLILPGASREVLLNNSNGRLPEGWRVVTLGDLCRHVADGPHFSPRYVEASDGVPFLSTRNVLVDEWSLGDVKYVSVEDHNEFSKRAKVDRGDILYTKGGTTGIAKVNDLDFEFSIWVHIALLKVRAEVVIPEFLAYALNTTAAYRQAQIYTHGTSNKDLGLQRMVKIRLPLPPMDLQHEIVRRLDMAVAAKRSITQRVAVGEQRNRMLLNSMVAPRTVPL